MPRRVVALVLFLVAFAALASFTPFARDASAQQLDPAFEAKLHDQLAATHSDLVSTWEHANQARDRHDLETAALLYDQIAVAAPEYDAALRRLCSVQTEQKKIDDAIGTCRRALAVA